MGDGSDVDIVQGLKNPINRAAVMNNGEYTRPEQELIERLPKLPAITTFRSSNIWIIEWLPSDEPDTGRQLHEWMEVSRSGWSTHISCRSKADVIRAIAHAQAFMRRTKQIPVLHIETHGDTQGLEGPDGVGGYEQLSWGEITGPLQMLNIETGCNLVVVVAACTGFAGISALTKGPRAPAIGLIGPTAELTGSDLLNGMKELYRGWRGEGPRMRDMVASASRETTGVHFEFEPFSTLFYEALVADLVRRLRQEKARMAEGHMPAAIPTFPPAYVLQRIWDEMFMMDVEPENRSRFGIDMTRVVTLFLDELGIAPN